MLGADVAALRSFAAGLNARSAEIAHTINHLAAVVETLPWVGHDREMFNEDWKQHHQPALATLVDELQATSAAVNRHADDQEATSRVGTGQP